MTVSISVLVDNTATDSSLRSEHGFSCAVRLRNGNMWLWDSGATGAFFDNAKAMGVDVLSARGLALSHGHWDHAGGVATLLRQGFTGSVYAHPEFSRKRYDIEDGKPARPIGIPDLPSGMELPDVRGLSDGMHLDDGITVITDIPRTPGLFEAIEGFYLDPEGREQDHVPDDASLVLSTPMGTVLLLGCCHSGVANTLNHLREEYGLDSLYAVVGGTHLMDATDDIIKESANAFRAFDVQHIYPAHCSGEKGFAGLNELLPGRVHPIGSGTVLTF